MERLGPSHLASRADGLVLPLNHWPARSCLVLKTRSGPRPSQADRNASAVHLVVNAGSHCSSNSGGDLRGSDCLQLHAGPRSKADTVLLAVGIVLLLAGPLLFDIRNGLAMIDQQTLG